MSVILRRCAGLVLLCSSARVQAHSPLDAVGQAQWAAGLSAGLLFGLWALYLLGSWRRRPPWPAAGIFHLGMLAMVIAVLGPLDRWAEKDAAAHMVQHMVFMVLVPPLWVLSRPLPQLVAGGGHGLVKAARPLLALTRFPMLCAWLHALVVWVWHMPAFYVLALEQPWWHSLEHASFILTASLFWWAVLRPASPQLPFALLALLFTLVHTGFLGALLTFAEAPLYGAERSLESQQLAGLIMWVLGAFPYFMASCWLGWRCYQLWERQCQHP